MRRSFAHGWPTLYEWFVNMMSRNSVIRILIPRSLLYVMDNPATSDVAGGIKITYSL